MPARKRSADSEESEDFKPDVKASPTKKVKGPTKGAKPMLWTKQEEKILFENVYPKQKGLKWEDIAKQIPGRDAKSCQNHLVVLDKKVQAAFAYDGE